MIVRMGGSRFLFEPGADLPVTELGGSSALQLSEAPEPSADRSPVPQIEMPGRRRGIRDLMKITRIEEQGQPLSVAQQRGMWGFRP